MIDRISLRLAFITVCLLIFSACGGSGKPAIERRASCGAEAQGSGLTPSSGANIDLVNMGADDGLVRVCGSAGTGTLGVPVSAGNDVDGDGHPDFAMAAMLASPEGRSNAGQVYLVFGNGELDYTLDTGAADTPRILTIIGEAPLEMTGSEIWMGDVTGDGLDDLLIARQNYSASSPVRIGSGALSIVVGGAELRTLATNGEVLDLGNPPDNIHVLTINGAASLDRLGIWVRVGDITGDGIEDIAVGADQADAQGENSGAAYVLRGGPHLASNVNLDLADIASSGIGQHIATVLPPINSANYHFGGTLTIADLDANGRAELLIAATLNRAGASVSPAGASNTAQSSGGFPGGRVFIVWDDNFSDEWPEDFRLVVDSSLSGGLTDIRGGATASFSTRYFGEEMVGGLDYNGDELADLFIGDIAGNTFSFTAAGLGFVFFDAASLKGQSFAMNNRPAELQFTTILGAEPGAISSDTALHGDFDNDGIADLAVASPHANPFGRREAGALHILWGQAEWPVVINLQLGAQPLYAEFAMTNIFGAYGTGRGDVGDTLAYSAAAADINADGFVDLIVNEMVGNGVVSVDAGNLIIISGATASEYK